MRLRLFLLSALPRAPLTFAPRLIRQPLGGPLTLYTSLPCAAARAALFARYVLRFLAITCVTTRAHVAGGRRL
ncbi:hypothetical protein ES703_88505 [subsurface metagenome]